MGYVFHLYSFLIFKVSILRLLNCWLIFKWDYLPGNRILWLSWSRHQFVSYCAWVWWDRPHLAQSSRSSCSPVFPMSQTPRAEIWLFLPPPFHLYHYSLSVCCSLGWVEKSYSASFKALPPVTGVKLDLYRAILSSSCGLLCPQISQMQTWVLGLYFGLAYSMDLANISTKKWLSYPLMPKNQEFDTQKYGCLASLK